MRLVAVTHFDHEEVDELSPAVEVGGEVRLDGRAQFLTCGLVVGAGSSPVARVRVRKIWWSLGDSNP